MQIRPPLPEITFTNQRLTGMDGDAPLPKHKRYPRYNSDKEKKLQADEKRGRGRPKGSANIRRQALVQKLVDEGVTPLHVMLNTMRDIWNEALKIEEFIPRVEKKMMAVGVAEKAAPFIHPKLASIEKKVEHTFDPDTKTDDEILEIVARLRAGSEGDEEDRSPSESDPIH